MAQTVIKLFGAPGTGKTTTLLQYLSRVMEKGVKPEDIGFVTFTRAARRQARQEVFKKFPKMVEDDLRFFRTLHSTCFQRMGLTKNSVVGHRELREFGEEFHYDFSYAGSTRRDEDMMFQTTGSKQGDRFLAFNHWRRHRLLPFEVAYRLWPDHLQYWEVQEFERLYMEWRRGQSLFDFTDMLEASFHPLPVKAIFLDEAQDLSDLQWRVFWQFAKNARAVYIAGDDDQGIYAWSGANPIAFLAVEGKVRVLEQSYRLPRKVFDLSQKLVKRISIRQPKNFNPMDREGEIVYHHDLRTVDFIKGETYKILVRNNYLKSGIIKELEARGIPFTDTGFNRLSEKVITALVAWRTLAAGGRVLPSEAEAAYELIPSKGFLKLGAKKELAAAKAGRKVVDVSRDDLMENFGLLKFLPWDKIFLRLSEIEIAYIHAVVAEYGMATLMAPLVDISTIHAAKGLEADNVVIFSEMSGRCKQELNSNPDNEYRVWYVGITRTKNRLHLVGDFETILGMEERRES